MPPLLLPVFLPWYHAYRMFVQCATNLEATSGKPFQRDAARALASTNTMDKWILAAVNGLVAFVRREVCARPISPQLCGRGGGRLGTMTHLDRCKFSDTR